MKSDRSGDEGDMLSSYRATHVDYASVLTIVLICPVHTTYDISINLYLSIFI